MFSAAFYVIDKDMWQILSNRAENEGKSTSRKFWLRLKSFGYTIF